MTSSQNPDSGAKSTVTSGDKATLALYGETCVVFSSYQQAVSAQKPAEILRVSAIVGGRIVDWVRNASGTCLGGGWSPADTVTPQHYGAVGNGVADDTAAFQAAVNALPASGGIIDLDARNFKIGLLNFGTRNVIFRGDDAKINGQHLPQSLGAAYEFYSSSLRRKFVNYGPAAPGDGAYRQNYRNANYVGGSGGTLDWIEKWIVEISPTVGSPGQRKAEKAALFHVINRSPHANGIAAMFRAEAHGAGAVWNIESSTESFVNPTTYAHRAAEFAITGTGLDPNKLRWIVDIVSHSSASGGVGNAYGPNDIIDRALNIVSGTADLRDAIVIDGAQSNGAKIRSSDIRIKSKANNQVYATCVEGTGTVRIGSTNRAGELGRIIVHGQNSAGVEVAYSSDTVIPVNGTSGSETAQRKIMVMSGGTMTEVARFQGGLANGIFLLLGGALRQVQVGAPDSGGSGFRTLVVQN